MFAFGTVLGPTFAADKRLATKLLSEYLKNDEGVNVGPFKKAFRRPRPYKFDPTLKPVCKTTTSTQSCYPCPVDKVFLAVLIALGFSTASLGQSKQIVVIAHRGEHLQHPENTLAAFQGAIDAGADFFELDVRTTSDGKLVLMHDSNVDRMTDGKGDVAAMSFDEIRKLTVSLKMGPEWAGTKVPTFDEALALARGKIGVYVDSKRISAQDAVDALTRHDMVDKVVIYGGARYLKEVVALQPKLKAMPEANNPATLKSLLEALPLKVVAFDANDFNDETIAVARAAHADIYVDRLGNADNPEKWQDAIDRGAAGLQTDHPAELVQYLKSKGYR